MVLHVNVSEHVINGSLQNVDFLNRREDLMRDLDICIRLYSKHNFSTEKI
jgi:hypothetical protein